MRRVQTEINRKIVQVRGNETTRHEIIFGGGDNFVQWIVLHPTFDDSPTDISTSKILKFSELFGFDASRIVALYPIRANTSNGIPAARRMQELPEACTFDLIKGAPVIVAWGDKCVTGIQAVADALSKIKREGHSPKALRRTGIGNPAQPSGVSFPGAFKRFADLQTYRPPLAIEQRMK